MVSYVTFILNAAAGADFKPELCDSLLRLYAEQGLDARIVVAHNGEQLRELARQAVSEHSEAVVAGGGDGTISTIASELLNTDIPLGVLPLGTLNHFAKDLRIPLDLQTAARSIATGRVSRIDVGEVNGRIFLNNSALGLYPSLISERQHYGRHGWGKLLASAEAAVSVVRRNPFLTVRVLADGEELTRTTPLVLISNNRYSMQGFRIGTRAVLTRGELCLYVARHADRADLLRLAMRTLLGMKTADELDVLTARDLDVETRRKRVRVALDGEVTWIESPLHYRSRPGALRVIVPVNAAMVA